MAGSLTPDQVEAALREIEASARRSRRERLTDYMIGGTMIAVLFVIAMIIVPLIPVALRPAPVTIDNVMVDTPMPVCPGDLMHWTMDIDVRERAIVGNWSVVQDADTLRAYGHTRQEHQALVRFLPNKWTAGNHYSIPELRAGDYLLVYGMAALNSDTNPEFVQIPFSVAEGCPPLAENREGD